jgi:hypothetical protein
MQNSSIRQAPKFSISWPDGWPGVFSFCTKRRGQQFLSALILVEFYFDTFVAKMLPVVTTLLPEMLPL